MNELVNIVGLEHVGAAAGLVTVAPASTEEMAAVMQVCAEMGLVVSPRGGGTKAEWGNAVAAQVVVETRRLAGVREHSWGDLTATVGAGTPWALMERELAAHGQRVALDPLFADDATVGGVIAVNDSGALRMRYGSLRDLVIGMTIVLADGTIARSGGRVVKNVAGYDLPKLLTGSFGTLGMIAEVTFRLHPVQANAQTWTVRSGDVRVLASLQQKLSVAAMSIESLQMRGEVEGFALDVRFASLPEVLIEHEGRLREMCGGLEVVEGAEDVWGARERLFAAECETVLKVTVLPSKMAAVLDGFAALKGVGGAQAECVADATGIVTVGLTACAEHAAAIVEDLRARLRADGGMVVVLRGDVSLDRWGGSPPAIAVMRAVKQEFDPGRLLNPGKFVGGI